MTPKLLGDIPRHGKHDREAIAGRLRDPATQAAARAWAANLSKDAQYLDDSGKVQVIRASRIRAMLEATPAEVKL